MRYHDMTKVAEINSSGLFSLLSCDGKYKKIKGWRKVAVSVG